MVKWSFMAENQKTVAIQKKDAHILLFTMEDLFDLE